jgi:ankyrin repeat protein
MSTENLSDKIEKNLQDLFFTAVEEGISKEESLRIIDLCLKAGVDVNMMSQPNSHRLQSTALMRASNYSSVEVVQKLLDSGADANLTNEKGMTALMYSVQNPDKNIYKLLLKTSDVNKENSKGWTALMFAMQWKDIAMANDFLAAGANINHQDKKGQTCLIRRSIAKDVNGIEFFLNSKAEVNRQDNDGWTALMYATKTSRFDCVQMLLNFGADITLKSKSGEDALSIAQTRQNKNILILFRNVPSIKSKKKIIDTKDAKGWTTLMYAVKQLQVDLCQKLLEEGANINLKNNKGQTALIILMSLHSWKDSVDKITDILLSYNPDINVRDNKGKTALIHAVDTKNDSNIIKLIKAGADISIKDHKGKTAIEVNGVLKRILHKNQLSPLIPKKVDNSPITDDAPSTTDNNPLQTDESSPADDAPMEKSMTEDFIFIC